MKKYILLIFIVLANSVFNSQAQSVSLEDEVKCNRAVLELINDYASSANLQSEEDESTFVNLFESPNQKIFNDLTPLVFGESVKVSEYIEDFYSRATLMEIDFFNIQRHDLKVENDQYIVELSMKKHIDLVDKHGVLFSTKEYYKEPYDIRMTVSYNPITDECKIQKLEGELLKTAPEIKDYAVWRSTDKRDIEVLFRGEHPKFNSFRQYIILDGIKLNIEDFEYPDANVRLGISRDKEYEEIFSLTYKHLHWTIAPFVNIPLTNFYTIQTSDRFNTESSAIEYGLNIGWMSSLSNTVKIGVTTGLGLSNSSFAMESTEAFERSVDVSDDIDGEDYVRKYQYNFIRQKNTFSDLIVPVMFSLNAQMSKRVELFANLGAKIYLNQSYDIDEYSVDGSVIGVYPDLVMTDLIEGFGSFNITNMPTNVAKPKAFSYDFVGEVGANINIYKKLFFRLGLGYQVGGSDYIVVDGSEIVSDWSSNAYTYHVNKSYEKDQAKDLYESVGNLKRSNIFSINLGLMLRF